jgi:hypothetical protein
MQKFSNNVSKFQIDLGAARSGDLSYFLWVLEKLNLLSSLSPFDTSLLACEAASSGSLEILKWLKDQIRRPAWDDEVMFKAIKGKSLPVLEWLVDHANEIFIRNDWREWVTTEAAASGTPEILIWAREKKFQWHEKVTLFLASGEDSEILEWAVQNGCPISQFAMFEAAFYGKLKNLQILRKYGTTWDDDTCEAAARSGNPELLQWVLENGCQGNSETFSNFVRSSSAIPEIVEILKNYGIPMDPETIGEDSGSAV